MTDYNHTLILKTVHFRFLVDNNPVFFKTHGIARKLKIKKNVSVFLLISF